MPKLLLINPINQKFSSIVAPPYPPLALGMIAALTPGHWEIKIADENFVPFEYEPADLVGLTAYTPTAYRAYQIAQLYKQRGISTVMGGIHASMLPQEALQFFDSVVIGEAESIWPKVIADFEQGHLERIYQGEHTDLKGLPHPRRDLFHPDYFASVIQTSRGCPHDCEFCSVSVFNQRRLRKRPIEEVLDELETIPQKVIFFVDDNLMGYSQEDRRRTLDLFQGIIRRGIQKEWVGSATVEMAQDQEILKFAHLSGCRLIALGLEADTDQGLSGLKKWINIKGGSARFNQAIAAFHRHGIAVFLLFILGLDQDTPQALKKRAAFIRRLHPDGLSLSLLTPLPGTRLFDRMQAQGRLVRHDFPADWQYYNLINPVISHPHLRPEALRQFYQKNIRKYYSRRSIVSHFIQTWFNTKKLKTALWSLSSNLLQRQNYKKLFSKSPELFETGNR